VPDSATDSDQSEQLIIDSLAAAETSKTVKSYVSEFGKRVLTCITSTLLVEWGGVCH